MTDTDQPGKNIIETALEAASLPDYQVIELPNNRQVIFAPDGISLQDVSDPERLDSYVSQRLVVDDK